MNRENREIDKRFWLIAFLIGILPLLIIGYLITKIIFIINNISGFQQKVLLIGPVLLAIVIFLVVFLIPILIIRNKIKKNSKQ